MVKYNQPQARGGDNFHPKILQAQSAAFGGEKTVMMIMMMMMILMRTMMIMIR